MGLNRILTPANIAGRLRYATHVERFGQADRWHFETLRRTALVAAGIVTMTIGAAAVGAASLASSNEAQAAQAAMSSTNIPPIPAVSSPSFASFDHGISIESVERDTARRLAELNGQMQAEFADFKF